MGLLFGVMAVSTTTAIEMFLAGSASAITLLCTGSKVSKRK